MTDLIISRELPAFSGLRHENLILYLIDSDRIPECEKALSSFSFLLHEFHQSYQPRYDNIGRRTKWGFIAYENGCVVGMSLLGVSSWEHLRGYTGADTAPDKRGRGIAPRSKIHLFHLGFALLGLNRIETGCLVTNHSSRRSIEKTEGFQFEGRLRQFARNSEGEFEDEYRYAILREDWAKLYSGIHVEILHDQSFQIS